MDNDASPEPLRWENWLAAGLMAVLAVVAFANVLSRYFLKCSLAFTEEITLNLFVLATLVGSGLAFEKGAQPGMVWLLERMPTGGRRAVAVLSAVAGAALMTVINVCLIRNIYLEVTLFGARSSSLNLPEWIYYALAVAASAAVYAGLWRGARARWGKGAVPSGTRANRKT